MNKSQKVSLQNAWFCDGCSMRRDATHARIEFDPRRMMEISTALAVADNASGTRCKADIRDFITVEFLDASGAVVVVVDDYHRLHEATVDRYLNASVVTRAVTNADDFMEFYFRLDASYDTQSV